MSLARVFDICVFVEFVILTQIVMLERRGEQLISEHGEVAVS